PQIPPLGPFFFGPDAILPVIGVGKTASRPTNHRGLQSAQDLNGVLPDPFEVGDLRSVADPCPVVNGPSDVLDHVPVNIPVDLTLNVLDIDHDFSGLRLLVTHHRFGPKTKIVEGHSRHGARDGKRRSAQEIPPTAASGLSFRLNPTASI